MTGVVRWTGREVKALRTAMRLTGRAFAGNIGVSHRMLVEWENRGEGIALRASNQKALDTLLAVAGTEVQERFAALLTTQAAAESDPRVEQLLQPAARLTKHPVDGKLMVPVDEGIHLFGPDNKPHWSDTYLIDVYRPRTPTTTASSAPPATGHPGTGPAGSAPAASTTTPWSG